MSAAELPDPLGFTARALAARGALVEVEGARAVALLPAPLAAELSLPEELAVSAHPVEGGAAVACGIGSPLLERLAADARRAVPWVALAPDVDAPKVSHATGLAARAVVRNGLAEVLDASVGDVTYARASVAWAVEADDRYEGVLHVAAGPDGAERDARVQALLEPAAHDGAAATLDAPSLRPLLRALPERISSALEGAVGDALASIERRHARDHDRMCEYFAGLVAEVGAGRRKVDPATRAARAATIAAERDARLRDLTVRYTPKVTATPVALTFAKLPAVRVRLRVRRRKGERELRVTLPGAAQALDLLACDGCGGSTARPALCDDRMHVLCERCAPNAQGRLDCLACERARRERRGR